jgi:DNA-binding CsgD family transcriptional regulator
MSNEGALAGSRASRIWARLVLGQLRAQPSRTDAVLWLAPPSAGPSAPEAWSGYGCLAHVLRGRAQKVVAGELGRSMATISSQLSRQLAVMGLGMTTLRVPLGLAMLAHAAHSELVELIDATNDGDCWGIAVQISPSSLSQLTASELDVAYRYLDGGSHAEIAAARASKPRTVANQLGAVFHHFGATGRFDLLRAILEHGKELGERSKLWLRAAAEPPRVVDVVAA